MLLTRKRKWSNMDSLGLSLQYLCHKIACSPRKAAAIPEKRTPVSFCIYFAIQNGLKSSPQ